MGVRPTVYILVGAINPTKVRDVPSEKIYEDVVEYFGDDQYYADAGAQGFDYKVLGDMVYNPIGDYPQVRGLILDELYDSDFFRAMVLFDEKYLEDGFLIFPQIDPDKINNFAYKNHYGFTEDDVKCNRFVETVFESVPSLSRLNWKRAVHYLSKCGYDVEEEELHYILLWEWK